MLLINFFATFAVAEKKHEKQPEFVGKQLEFYSKHKYAKSWLTRPMGWGKGIYKAEKGREVEFFWFAYSNANGWMQFDLNTRLRVDDTLKIESITDSYQRPWETLVDGNTTWIGTTNEWVDRKGYCRFTRDDTLVCDFKKALLFILREINKQEFINFEIRSYLDWPK